MKKVFKLIGEIRQLERKQVTLSVDHEEGARLFNSFTSRHPRLFVVKFKELGVALIDLLPFTDFEAYTDTVKGKNSAVYFARRCTKMGYTFRELNPNQYQQQIMAINASAGARQGREMDASYLREINYPVNDFNRYYGVFLDEELVAYCWTVRSGELILLNRLLGHQSHLKNNVMYKLIMDVIEEQFGDRSIRYVMYDTFFGAGEGLRLFKKRMGFVPYRVKWNK